MYYLAPWSRCAVCCLCCALPTACALPETTFVDPTDADHAGDGDTGGDQDAPDSDPSPGDSAFCGGAGDEDGVADAVRVGAWNTLEAVTWNLKSLPVSSGTVTHIAELLERMAVDLVAVEKVADVSAFEQLVAALPHHDGVVSPDGAANGTYLKTGFIYRTDQLHLLDTTSLFTDEPNAFPRPPFRAWFEEILADCSTRSFVATVLHLAPGTGAAEARRQAMGLLKDNLDDLVAASPQVRLLVLGDFNDQLDASATNNIFTDFLADTTHYTILTQPLSTQDNVYSFLPTQQLIDHVMVTASWLDTYADPGGTTEVLPLDRLITEYNYEQQVSNHLPVVATFAR